MMNIVENLEATHEHAKNMFVEMYDPTNGIVKTSPSHPDLWPGDLYRYVEGALAVGETDIAEGMMKAAGRSIRNDSSFPHYMLGSHMRLGGRIETNWIDRKFQAISGNGIEKSRSGEWVSGILAPPTFGLAAAALVDAGIELPSNLGVRDLVAAHHSLTISRRNNLGLIETNKRDELTNNSGRLASTLKDNKSIVDLAINASYILNIGAIAGLIADRTSIHYSFLATDARIANAAVEAAIAEHHENHKKLPFPLEMTQAAARLGLSGMIRTEDLIYFFREPNPRDDHPERTRPTFADAIEVARLTSGCFEQSRNFLVRALGKLSSSQDAFTRYEDNGPSNNALANRVHRSQPSTQTAAEAALIAYDMIS